MKTKITVGTIMALFFATVLTFAFTPTAFAHTEANPFVTDLIAGQTTDIGDILVWNDADNLYVRYETTSDWFMGRTQLQVATSLAGIPQTKGNPIPGHFDFKTTHDPMTDGFTYVIDLNSWTPGTQLYLAAHADALGPAGGSSFVEGVLATVPMLIYPEGYNIGTITASIVGGNLIVAYNITFTPAGWTLLETDLFVGFAPPSYPPPWATFPLKHQGLGGVTKDSFSVSLADLGVRCNDVLFISAHASARWQSTFTLFRDAWGEVTLSDGWQKWFPVTIPCRLVGETAWGEGLPFPGKNWAMYFTYTVQ